MSLASNRRLLLVLSAISCLLSRPLLALHEIFELYDAPEALAMGNALTSDASGHVSNYYNPAGLAKATKKQWEFIPIAFDAFTSMQAVATAAGAQSFGIHQTANRAKLRPSDYIYERLNFMPVFSRRNVAITLLGSYQNAGRSDGVSYDIDSKVDLAPAVGYGINLAGNLLKLGFTLKSVLRTQIRGKFRHEDLSSEDDVKARMSEGIAVGGDLGVMVTLPNRFLPTLGVAWKDVMDTQFRWSSHFLNPRAGGTPDRIPQSFHFSFSLKPNFGKKLKGLLAAELRHFERTDLEIRKKLHFGIRIESERSFFLWGGLNQFYWTAGMGLRLRGGNLEVGSYGVEIGSGAEREQSRRFFMRYTIGF